jgi:hypothetical protein
MKCGQELTLIGPRGGTSDRTRTRMSQTEEDRTAERQAHADSERKRRANQNEDDSTTERKRHADAERERRSNRSAQQREQVHFLARSVTCLLAFRS